MLPLVVWTRLGVERARVGVRAGRAAGGTRRLRGLEVLARRLARRETILRRMSQRRSELPNVAA